MLLQVPIRAMLFIYYQKRTVTTESRPHLYEGWKFIVSVLDSWDVLDTNLYL